MKYTVCAILMTFALASLWGCDDGDGTSTTPNTVELYGTYRVLSVFHEGDDTARPKHGGEIDDRTLWLRFEDDNLFHFLQDTPLGFRTIQRGVFLATPDQVVLPSGPFNYTLIGTTLTLTRPGEEVTARIDAGAPTATEWISTVTVLESTRPPVPTSSDLTWDGSTIWHANGSETNHLYRLDPATLTAVDSLQTDMRVRTICYDGGHLWVDDYSRIVRINIDTGQLMAVTWGMNGHFSGLAFDGTYLWVLSYGRILYQFDPEAFQIVSQLSQLDEIRTGIGGMEVVDGYLYICTNQYVNRCTLSPFGVESVYEFPGRYISGITHDGTDFYLTYSCHNGYKVARVSLGG